MIDEQQRRLNDFLCLFDVLHSAQPVLHTTIFIRQKEKQIVIHSQFVPTPTPWHCALFGVTLAGVAEHQSPPYDRTVQQRSILQSATALQAMSPAPELSGTLEPSTHVDLAVSAFD